MTRTITTRFPASRLLSLCLLGIVFIVALMPLHSFISTWGGTAIGPLLLWKSWKEVLLVVLLLVLLVWIVKTGRLKLFFSDNFVVAISLYGLLTLAYAAVYLDQNGLEATAAGLAMNLRYPLIALLGYGVFRFSNIDYSLWRQRAALFLIATGVFLAIVGILQVTVISNDFLTQFGYDKSTTIAPYTLIDENPDALRAFATLRGPNDFGAYLILPLILTLIYIRKSRWMVVSALVIAAGIAASGARSAWIGALVAISCFTLLTVGKRVFASKQAIVGIGVGLVLIVVVFLASLSIPAVRLAIFHSSPSDGSLTEGSTDAHWMATSAGLQRVGQNSFGCGPGCAGPASYYRESPQISENYYVQIMEEVGIGGFVLWLAFVGIVARRLYAARADWLARALLASGVGLSLIGLWLHVWSDDPLSLTWWAFVGMVLGTLARTYAGKNAKNSVS